MNKVWIKVTHMFLLLTELSRSPISCLYFLWSKKTILALVTKHYSYSEAEKCLIHLCGVNLLNRLWVFDLLPLLTICYLILWRNRIHRKRLSSDHQVFSYSTTLTGDLKEYKTKMNYVKEAYSRRYLGVNPLKNKGRQISVVFLPRSRCQWSHTGDGFCQRDHRRGAQWRASPETWLSWGQSVQ